MGVPVEFAVNWTVRGAAPEVVVPSKETSGNAGAVVVSVVVAAVGVVVVVVTLSTATGRAIPAINTMTRKTGKKKGARGHGSPDLSDTSSG